MASDEEMNSEADEWEEQQIKKAVPSIVDITGNMIMFNYYIKRLHAVLLHYDGSYVFFYALISVCLY